MTPRIHTSFCILTLLAAFGAGCASAPPAQQLPTSGGQETPPSSAAAETEYTPVYSVFPCTLVTSADAKNFLGGDVMEPYTEEGGEPAHTFCRYTTTQASDLSRGIEIAAYESDNLKASVYELPAEEYFNLLKTARKASQPEAFAPITGLGDDAYWDNESIRVRKGPVVLTVAARGFGSGDEDTVKKNKEATLKVAQKAVAGLK